MAQPIRNINDEQRQQATPAPPVLPPPEVAVERPRPRRKDWALHAMGLGAIFAMCYFAEEILVVILLSVLLAFMLAPVFGLLSKLHLPRWLCALLSVIILVAIVGTIGYFGVNQAVILLGELPKYLHRVHDKIAGILRKTQSLQMLGEFSSGGGVSVHEATNWTALLTRGFGSASEILLIGSFVPVLVFFMLTWQEHVRSATVGLFPLEQRRQVYSTLGMISGMVRDFLLGNLIIALLIGVISMTVYAFLGIPFFYFAGFLSGILSLVPYFGAVLAILPPLFLGVGKLSLAHIGWIVLTAFALHLVAMNVLYPKLLGGRLRLNPLAVTIALLFWGWLWGAMGLLLAVPITAGMKIIFDNVASLRPFGVWLGVEGPLESRARNGG